MKVKANVTLMVPRNCGIKLDIKRAEGNTNEVFEATTYGQNKVDLFVGDEVNIKTPGTAPVNWARIVSDPPKAEPKKVGGSNTPPPVTTPPTTEGNKPEGGH